MQFLEEIQRPEKYSFDFARYRFMDDQEHYFSRAKFGDDYSRVSHGGLESVTSIELDLDCLAISNTNDLQ